MIAMDDIQPCWVPHEPGVAEVLNDPIVKAVMRADGLDREELAAVLGIEVRQADRSSHRARQKEAAPC